MLVYKFFICFAGNKVGFEYAPFCMKIKKIPQITATIIFLPFQ